MDEDREFTRLQDSEVDRCGIGQGEACCAYLSLGSNGFICQHFTGLASYLRNQVRTRSIGARRLPEEDYPNCQLEV